MTWFRDIISAVIYNAGAFIAQRKALNFSGQFLATDDAANNRINVSLVALDPLTPQPVTLQGSIIVDPNNTTGVASATGISTATVDGSTGRVFNSWANLVAAWGTTSPFFSQNVEIVFASPNAISDPIFFYPRSNTGSCAVTIRAPKTVTNTVTLGAVTAKNRATNTLLQADLTLLGIGQSLLINTTRGNSVAFVETFVSGTTWNITQPFAPVAPPSTGVPAENDTWVAGDSVQVNSLVQLVIGEIRPALSTAFPSGGSNFVNLYRIKITNVASAAQMGMGAVNFVECRIASPVVPMPSNGMTSFLNSYLESGGIPYSFNPFKIIGGASLTGVGIQVGGAVGSVANTTVLIDGDFIARGAINVNGNLMIGFMYHSATATAINCAMGRVELKSQFFGGKGLYGGAGSNINMQGRTSFFLNGGTFAAAFLSPALITPGILLNNASTGSSQNNANPTTVVSGNIGTTVANLDAAQGAAGFGGEAFKFGGASVRNTQA